MKILTLNINSIRAHIHSVIKLLESSLYDVILLQEIKVETNIFPYSLFDSYPYNIQVFGQKSWNGVAIFSKHSIEDIILGIPNYNDPNARFLECVVNGNIRIINTYMPNGDLINSEKFFYKLEWLNYFSKYIEKYKNSSESVIIAGDFNIALTDKDVWNPKIYENVAITSQEARSIMNNWLHNGWTDAWRYFNKEDIGYTWYGYRSKDSVNKKQGLRLDYFLVNKEAFKLIKYCYIDINPRLDIKPTDHTGLVLELIN